MIVRPIEPGDADGLIAVFEAVAREGRWIGAELPLSDDRTARLRASAEHPSEHSCTFVAVDRDLVVGFARVELDRGRSQLAMALVAEYRGRGLGRELVGRCVEWSMRAGAHKVDLEVWPHNTAARRLYERAGFAVEGRRRRHWRRTSGELWDSIEMSLVLDETSPSSPYGESDAGE